MIIYIIGHALIVLLFKDCPQSRSSLFSIRGRQKTLILFGGGIRPYANFTQFEQFRPIGVNIVCDQNFKGEGGGICEKNYQGGTSPPCPPPLSFVADWPQSLKRWMRWGTSWGTMSHIDPIWWYFGLESMGVGALCPPLRSSVLLILHQ